MSTHRGGVGTAPERVRAAVAASHLRTLPEAVIDRLSVGARLVAVDAGAVIRREGSEQAHLDLVVRGLVRIFVTGLDGRTMTVRYMRPGGLFGALSLYASPFVLPATIQALTEAQVLQFPAGTVRWAADRDVRVARALIDELTDRVMSFISEIPSGAFTTVRQRVARHLLDLASATRGDGPLAARVTQQELADAVGSVREVVVRELRELREAELIRTGRERIVILDPEGVAAEGYPDGVHTGGRVGGT